MTRQYATFDCGMWDDPGGFSSLTAGAQRTYFMLVTQRDIAPCGLLPLTVRRWAATCQEKDIKAWLDELAEEKYIVFDEDSEELLVRTFMKWDAGYKHAKRVQAVIASAKAIRSELIRRIAAQELAMLGVPIGSLEPIESLRSVVTEVFTDHTPHSMNQGGEPRALDASVEPPPMFCTKHPDGTEEPCGPCGDARKRYASWAQAKTEREVEAKRAAAEARKACELCDERGMRLDPKTRLPVGRCDHQPVEVLR